MEHELGHCRTQHRQNAPETSPVSGVGVLKGKKAHLIPGRPLDGTRHRLHLRRRAPDARPLLLGLDDRQLANVVLFLLLLQYPEGTTFNLRESNGRR